MGRSSPRCYLRQLQDGRRTPAGDVRVASQETDDVRLSICPSFAMGPPSSGQFMATVMWDEIKKHGSFGHAGAGDALRAASKPGSSVGAAVAASTFVPAGVTRVVSLSLAWTCPEVKFPAITTYHRRYTKSTATRRQSNWLVTLFLSICTGSPRSRSG
ncbi:unnamed protein product [Urochloa humidicola]